MRCNCDFNGEAKVAIHLLSLSRCLFLFLHPDVSSLIELAVRDQVKRKKKKIITGLVHGKLAAFLEKWFDLKSSPAARNDPRTPAFL